MHEALTPSRHLEGPGVAGRFEHPVAERLFVCQKTEHPLLDRAFADEVEHGDGVVLVFAPGAGDALFQARGVPRLVAVDDHAGVLEVQAQATRVGAQQHAAARVLAEPADFLAALGGGEAAGVRGEVDPQPAAGVGGEFEHALPLAEDEHLDLRIAHALG